MQPSAFGIVPSPGAFGDRWQSRWPLCCARCPTGSLRSLGCSPGVTPLSPERAQSCSPGGADPAPVWPHGAQQRGGLCPAACPLTPQPRRPPVPSTQVPVVPSAPLSPRPQSPRWAGRSRRGHRWWGAVGADTLSSTPPSQHLLQLGPELAGTGEVRRRFRLPGTRRDRSPLVPMGTVPPSLHAGRGCGSCPAAAPRQPRGPAGRAAPQPPRCAGTCPGGRCQR